MYMIDYILDILSGEPLDNYFLSDKWYKTLSNRNLFISSKIHENIPNYISLVDDMENSYNIFSSYAIDYALREGFLSHNCNTVNKKDALSYLLPLIENEKRFQELNFSKQKLLTFCYVNIPTTYHDIISYFDYSHTDFTLYCMYLSYNFGIQSCVELLNELSIPVNQKTGH